jgi:hypothetical protein
MRRAVTIALIGVGLSLTLVSEGVAAASEPNVTASATRVKKGEPVDFTARNCSSGSGYTAVIEVNVTNPDGSVSQQKWATDTDGETTFGYSFDVTGTYRYEIYCRHEGKGTWWGPEVITVEVYEDPVGTTPTITDAERKKCKKINKKKKRKRCLKQAALD